MALSILLVVVALALAAALAFHPRLRGSEAWQATVVPLASIMGSGFLVSAPLLGQAVGRWAMPSMAALLAVAFALGHVIRFNIQYAEPREAKASPRRAGDHRLQHAHGATSDAHRDAAPHAANTVERISHLGLALAYVVTIAYYLKLLAAFALSQIGVEAAWAAPALASGILAGLTLTGLAFGLGLLEKLDRYAIALNFGVIAAILLGLLVYNGRLLAAGQWALPPQVQIDAPTQTLRVLMGLLIVVQGFETSRFLGSEHSAALRVRSMRWAQLLSSAIYVLFLGLITALFQGGGSQDADVTAVIALLKPVAPVLPLLVLVAAIFSQFSAAVADDSGNVGLVRSMLGPKVPSWVPYLLIGGLAAGIIWGTDPVQVIAWASRAFAAFYALQCVVAVLTVARVQVSRPRLRQVAYSVLGVVSLAVAVFGVPAG
ncbi:MAG: hypothetical protein VX899_13985 [Myxococcota bacterium]|nr:hypothetical protein [Myxococcota bacterium]